MDKGGYRKVLKDLLDPVMGEKQQSRPGRGGMGRMIGQEGRWNGLHCMS